MGEEREDTDHSHSSLNSRIPAPTDRVCHRCCSGCEAAQGLDSTRREDQATPGAPHKAVEGVTSVVFFRNGWISCICVVTVFYCNTAFVDCVNACFSQVTEKAAAGLVQQQPGLLSHQGTADFCFAAASFFVHGTKPAFCMLIHVFAMNTACLIPILAVCDCHLCSSHTEETLQARLLGLSQLLGLPVIEDGAGLCRREPGLLVLTNQDIQKR